MRPDAPLFGNAYPALLCAGAVAVGIGAAFAFAFWTWIAGVGGALLAAAVIMRWEQQRFVSLGPLAWTFAVLLALAATGAARFRQDRALPPAHVGHLAADVPTGGGLEVVLEGRIREAPRRSRQSTRFLLSARRLFAPPDTAFNGPVPAAGAVEVTLRPSAWEAPNVPFPQVTEGDVVRLQGQLRPPPHQRNPSDFDYGAYLRRRGIYAVMPLYEPEGVIVTGRARTWLERWMVPARHYVERQLILRVPSSEARAVLQALLLGDRSLLTDETEEHFRQTGLMHLLAVSGLHVLLVGWLFYQVLRPMLLRLGFRWRTAEMLRTGLTGGVLLFYVLLAGAPPSATRATIMAALLMGATLAQRPSRSLNALGAAAVLLLLWRPAQLFDAGFQLSFAAVGGILALGPRLRRPLTRRRQATGLRRWLVKSVVTTLAATLGTLPVLLMHFEQVPLAGLMLNLWAIPLMAVALAGALSAVACGGWAPPVAASFGAAADSVTQALLWTARAGSARGPWTLLRAPEAGAWLLAVVVLLLLMLALWTRPRWRWRLAILAAALVAIYTWTRVLYDEHALTLDVLFFDVGHGDAALLSAPDGRRVLIDAGGHSPAFDAAQTTLLPHLERYGIDRLSTIVLSHPDGDHLGGLPALLRRIQVGRLVTNGDTTDGVLYAEAHHLIDSLHVPLRTVRAGDTLRFGPGMSARVFSPTRHLVDHATENNASLVLQVAYGQTRLLFPGDAEAEAEALLTASYGSLLKSDVVKMGHHGSETSSLPAFIRASTEAGTFAVASSGRRFGLPDSSVLRRWVEAGARPTVTAYEGAVWLRSDGESVWRVRWR